MIHSQKSIETLVNLINISYCAMKILPYKDETLAQYKDISMQELWLVLSEWTNRFQIVDYEHAYNLVFEYINTFYNTVRIHSHCGYKSPQEYKKEYLNNLEAKVRKTG